MTESRDGTFVRPCSAAVGSLGLGLVLAAAGAGEKLGRVAPAAAAADAVIGVSDSTATVIGEPVTVVPLIGGATVQVRLGAGALAAGSRVAPGAGGTWVTAAAGRVVLETGGAAGELVVGRVAVSGT